MPDPHHVVIVGGGVAGLGLATDLARRHQRELRVTLIDREPAHVWKPMLHTIAAGTQDIELQQTNFLVHAATHGFTYEPGQVVAVDRESRAVTLSELRVEGEVMLPSRTVSYDTLVLSAGSKANDFGTLGVAEHCRLIDSRSDAVSFNRALRALLMQKIFADEPVSIAIVGAGATGIELAAELVRTTEIVAYLTSAPFKDRLKITVLEAGMRILSPFPERVAQATRDKLASLGVIVMTGAEVSSADTAGFVLKDGSRVDADLRVWAAGVRAADFLRDIDGLECSRAGQVIVDGTLRSRSDGRIFALGDCAQLTQPSGKPLPPTAQVADQQAQFLGRHLADLICGKHAPEFEFSDRGSLIAVGGYDAFGSLGPKSLFKATLLRGRVACLGHSYLYRRHQVRLHGFWRGSLLWLCEKLAARVRPLYRAH